MDFQFYAVIGIVLIIFLISLVRRGNNGRPAPGPDFDGPAIADSPSFDFSVPDPPSATSDHHGGH
jgi:hypothetical protein